MDDATDGTAAPADVRYMCGSMYALSQALPFLSPFNRFTHPFTVHFCLAFASLQPFFLKKQRAHGTGGTSFAPCALHARAWVLVRGLSAERERGEWVFLSVSVSLSLCLSVSPLCLSLSLYLCLATHGCVHALQVTEEGAFTWGNGAMGSHGHVDSANKPQPLVEEPRLLVRGVIDQVACGSELTLLCALPPTSDDLQHKQ